ncbi:hypothetical protein E1B28_001315 [Marasmius oreades]|uniref:Uncharacterized protein n=1 Tax=Marasmius oreades TaxID=181124 RepID=A0A9P8AFI5_9AGAR|nr:uncharacterized protein E1B28_001315 [Marasmius oreades]KAG7099465.1 hypothetical protein E1B28_001315 [Marasmius oreades]
MSTFAITRVYTESFNRSPTTTLAFVGGSLNAFGDSVAQFYQKTYGRKEHEVEPRYDFARTLRFFVFGFGMSPLIGRWNTFLERQFPLRTSGNVSLKALVKRVASDQLLMAPVGITLFLGSMGVMEGRNVPQIRQKFSDIFPIALTSNWQVWPIVQLINFRFMPLPYRVPFQSTCGVFWTLYLSVINSREDRKQDYEAGLRRTIHAT